jgi:hypothetical protein
MSRHKLVAFLSAAAVWTGLCAYHDSAFWRYFLSRMPSDAASSLRGILGGACVTIVVALLLSFIAWGVGLRLMSLLKEDALPAFLQDALAFALGLGAVAEGIFALGLLGLLRPAPLGVWVSAAAAIAAFPAFLRLRSLLRLSLPGEAPRGPQARPPAYAAEFARGALFGFIAYASWYAAVWALAPPLEWDELAYHLSIPKLYWHWGSVREIPWMLHSHWPHLTEMLYVVPLALGRDSSAQFLHVLICAAWLGAVYAVARERLGLSPALVAVAAVASQMVVFKTAFQAHSDGAVALFYFLAAYSAWSWSREPRPSRLLLAAILAGFCASAKLLGMLWAGGVCLWILLASPFPFKKRAQAAAAFGGIFLLIAAPWYLKAWFGAGNPVWPFLSGIFGGFWNGPLIEAPFVRVASWNPPLTIRQILAGYDPQYLAAPALAMAVLGWIRGMKLEPLTRALLLQMAVPALALANGNVVWRYLMPAYPALGMLVGERAVRLWRQGAAGRMAAAATALATVCPLWLDAGENNALFAAFSMPPREIAGSTTREEFLDRSLDIYPVCRRINRLLGPADKLLLFREIRGYYLDVPYQWGDPINQGVILYRRLGNPEQLRRTLAEQGITHVLVNTGVGLYQPRPDYYDFRTLRLMGAVLARDAHPILQEGPVTLYALDKP